jgi:hypothetical protein
MTVVELMEKLNDAFIPNNATLGRAGVYYKMFGGQGTTPALLRFCRYCLRALLGLGTAHSMVSIHCVSVLSTPPPNGGIISRYGLGNCRSYEAGISDTGLQVRFSLLSF